jgi:hypothetical protein
MPPPLGRLEPVELRTVFASEGEHFTPWLAEEANLKFLGESIGIELEFEAREKYVGPFRADILCKDASDDTWVLIENQLESTDHKHLGQLLTYAAGLDAVTVVWIAASFTDEHRAALDWLNQATGERFKFFGLEVELLRIGQSPPAPNFKVVSNPNDWSSSVSSAANALSDSPMTPTQQLQLDFWTQFNGYLATNYPNIKRRRPKPRHWMSFGIGRVGFHVSTLCVARDGWIGVNLNCSGPHAKQHFHQLEVDKRDIEAMIGAELDWQELPDNIVSRIYLRNRSVDPKDIDNWPSQFSWLAEKLSLFISVFRPRILNLSDATDGDVAESDPSDSDLEVGP